MMPQGQAMGMPAQAQAPQAPQKEGGASKILADVHSGMMEIAELVASSPGIEPELKQEAASIVSAIQGFAEKLSAPQGQPKAQPAGPAPTGNVPPEAGRASVIPAP